jgi:hypothetical protein
VKERDHLEDLDIIRFLSTWIEFFLAQNRANGRDILNRIGTF